MTIEEFCSLNGKENTGTFEMLEGCVFPEGEFECGFTFVMYSLSGRCAFRVMGKEMQVGRRCMTVFRPGITVEKISSSDNFRCKVLLIGGDLGIELNISNVFLTLFIMDETPVLKVSAAYGDAVRLFFEAFSRVVQFERNPYTKDCLLSLLRAFFYSSGYFLFKSLRFKG
ncbi:MAG: hypothetical protein HUJ94_04940, partial [Bacteroidales bacterium]|nr:hypothetical protein [Bacteroidales bacterium]